jgi:hypothetical protein
MISRDLAYKSETKAVHEQLAGIYMQIFPIYTYIGQEIMKKPKFRGVIRCGIRTNQETAYKDTRG